MTIRQVVEELKAEGHEFVCYEGTDEGQIRTIKDDHCPLEAWLDFDSFPPEYDLVQAALTRGLKANQARIIIAAADNVEFHSHRVRRMLLELVRETP